MNMRVKAELPFDDDKSFLLAEKNLKLKIPDQPVVWKSNGNEGTAWDPTRFDFVQGEAPDTVNPSLWRQSKLTRIGGLFEVKPCIYQVRNFDLANMTIIESEQGLIIADVLTSAETAKASLEMYYAWKKERKPVIAVIISHSHIDHFAGIINGVTTMQDIENENVKVYAPEGFLNHACMENFYMGNIMGRRAAYMYGTLLPADEKGDVGVGLGTTRAVGTLSLLQQKWIQSITDTFEERTIGNLKFQFQLVPGTEAPAEMHFYIEDYKALCTAENAVHTMHNVYSLRGAQIRDSLSWSKDLNLALQRWGSKVETLVGVHHWPVWGNDNIITYLKRQRDLYRYLNDQTLRLANLGYKPLEVAEQLRKLPPNLETDWDARGYYGSLNHNIKSVFVKYLGWFDGNPATLHAYPLHEAGTKYVEFMGGAEALLAKAKTSYAEGDYRWVAEVVNHLIFSYPNNAEYYEEAKALQADALEQLGYQAESGPWRNFYLSGALELRRGVQTGPQGPLSDPSFLLSVPADIFFDYMGMLLKGWEMRDAVATIRVVFQDSEETYELELENGALNHTRISPSSVSAPDSLTVFTARAGIYNLIVGIAVGRISNPAEALAAMIDKGLMRIEGDMQPFVTLLEHLQTLDRSFNIVEPIAKAKVDPESDPL
jgi:alkyl sulfatase BDS1-like metallo-beta-lactamase superfamily hydrolase